MKHIGTEAFLGFFWLGSSRLLQQGIGWVLSILIARILLPSDYGLMALANVYIYFISYFNELSFGSAIIQKREISDEYLDSTFWFSLGASGMIYGFSFFFASIVADFFKHGELVPIIRVLGISLIIMGFSIVPSSLIWRDLEFRKSAKANFLSELSMSIGTLVFAYLGCGVWSLVMGSLIRSVVFCSLMFYLSRWRPGWYFSISHIKELMGFGIPMTGSKMIHTLYSNVDSIMLGKMLGNERLGFFYMADRLSNTPVVRLTRVINDVNFPILSKIQREAADARKYFLQTTKYVILLIFPALIGMFLISNDFITIFLGKKWNDAIIPLKVLCFISMFRVMNSTIQPLLIAMGKVHVILKFEVISTLLLISGLFVGSRYGLNGAVVGLLAVQPLITGYLLVFGLHLSGIGVLEYLGSCFPGLRTCVAMLVTVTFLQLFFDQGVVRFVASVVGGIVVYAVLLLLKERETLKIIKGRIASVRWVYDSLSERR